MATEIVTTPIPAEQWSGVPSDRRTSKGLPLPAPGNSAKIDVIRIAAALILVDGMIADVQTDIAEEVAAAFGNLQTGAPAGLNTFAEVAAALSNNANFASDLDTILQTLATKSSLKTTADAVVALADRVAAVENDGNFFLTRLHFGGL